MTFFLSQWFISFVDMMPGPSTQGTSDGNVAETDPGKQNIFFF